MNLRRLNKILLGLIIIVNLYVIVTPLVPALVYQIGAHGNKRQQLSARLHPKANQKTTTPSNQPNKVVIPAMLLDQPILEGKNTYAVLNKGILRWPAGSTPDKGGNTILIGHRFTYTLPKGVFYYMDKLKVGDEIGITWNNKLYVYRVSSTTVVPPTDTAIENPTPDARLTLFTCTPLWLPKNRLVVVANLEQPVQTTAPTKGSIL